MRTLVEFSSQQQPRAGINKLQPGGQIWPTTCMAYKLRMIFTCLSGWKKPRKGVPLRLRRLRIWHGHCCGTGLVLSPGTSYMLQPKRKKKEKKRKKSKEEYSFVTHEHDKKSNFQCP